MRLTKRKGGFVYINTETIPRSDCEGLYGFMPCQFMKTCRSVGTRKCPVLRLMDKLADLEDKEEKALDINTEVAREIFAEIEKIICKYSIYEYSKETGVFIRTSYNGNAIAKAIAELKNKYIGGVK